MQKALKLPTWDFRRISKWFREARLFPLSQTPVPSSDGPNLSDFFFLECENKDTVCNLSKIKNKIHLLKWKLNTRSICAIQMRPRSPDMTRMCTQQCTPEEGHGTRHAARGTQHAAHSTGWSDSVQQFSRSLIRTSTDSFSIQTWDFIIHKKKSSFFKSA